MMIQYDNNQHYKIIISKDDFGEIREVETENADRDNRI